MQCQCLHTYNSNSHVCKQNNAHKYLRYSDTVLTKELTIEKEISHAVAMAKETFSRKK